MEKLAIKKGGFSKVVSLVGSGEKEKALTINYCKEGRERMYLQNLKQTEEHLTQLSEQGQLDDDAELITIQDKIKDYERKHLQGARIRAKVEEIEQGERCTSYFVNLEKQKAKNKFMHLY